MVSAHLTKISVYMFAILENKCFSCFGQTKSILKMSFQVSEVQKRVVTEEKITVVTEREESPPPAGT